MNENDTLKWGMLCVALGFILYFIRMMQNKKHHNPYKQPAIMPENKI